MASELIDIASRTERLADAEIAACEDLGSALVEAPDLLIFECGAEGIEVIRQLRTASLELAILAVTATVDDIDAACEAGADDAIAAAGLSPQVLGHGARNAQTHRSFHRNELGLLKSVQRFGETLILEERLDKVVELVLEEVRWRTGAEIALLVVEWEWRGVADRVAAVRGVDADGDGELLAALREHSGLSPLHHDVQGIRPLEGIELSGPLAGLGELRTSLMVPVGRAQTWGRGGLVLLSPRTNAFEERDLRIATVMAAWAGVAILHASTLHERNRAIELRERVLAIASHDLRTPLSTFSVALEILAESDDAAEREALFERAGRAVDRMKRLIGDLQDYAALDAGKLRIERQSARAVAIARRCVENLSASAERAGVELALEAEGDPRFEVDPGRVEQALSNIITNAIKFTPSGGRVVVRVSAGDDAVDLSVADSGPGIPEELQRKLFDRYVSGSRDGAGVGLGLSIARGIVAAHQGTVSVDSSPGEGATFVLTIPIRPRGRSPR